MTDADYILGLKRMGYRQPNPAQDANVWVKPFGYNIIIAHVKERRIASHFASGGTQPGLVCWTSEEIKDDVSASEQITMFEQYNALHGGHTYTDFGFLTTEQYYEGIL